MITEINYRSIVTQCKTCQVVHNFMSDDFTIEIDETWKHQCTTEDCQGDTVVIIVKEVF